jgi:hypothetical protein
MNKIKIYTYCHNRPDFIALQYESIKRHLKDDFEYIVFNNERPGGDGGFDEKKIQIIYDKCEQIGVQCIRVELDKELQYLNNNKMFEGETYINGNTACAYSFTWGWKNYISKNDCISLLIDSDMFFIKDILITDIMDGYNFSFVPSYRYVNNEYRNIAFKYPWNGLVIADIPNMPNPQEISWGDGWIDSLAVDVGGEVRYYLEKYESQLKINYIDQWGLCEDTQVPNQLVLNGCSEFKINFDEETLNITQYQHSDSKTFPHQIDRENYWDYFTQNYIKIKNITKKYNFPKPTFVDFMKLEKDSSIDDAFIFHYKNASNTLPWMKGEVGEVYNEEKTECLKKFLNNFI